MDTLENLLREATRLTTTGRLQEATELIQRSLGARQSHTAADRDEDARPPIEGSFYVVMPDTEAPRSPSEPAPQKRDIEEAPGQFIDGIYRSKQGEHHYKLYIPGGRSGQVKPLIVMLHGCTQNPDDFALGTGMNLVAEQQHCYVLYPAQSCQANASRCWNWFRDGDQMRDQGEPTLLADMTQAVMRQYPISPRQVYVAGLSAGGAMALIMGIAYPDLYAAIGVHSGLPYRAARDLPSALAAMQGMAAGLRVARDDTLPTPPTIVFHGDKDTTVHPANGDRVIAQARPGDRKARQHQPDTVRQGKVHQGHRYTVSAYHDAAGRTVLEHWLIHGAAHAWSGGNRSGSYTDPQGPNASEEMLRFFLSHGLPQAH